MGDVVFDLCFSHCMGVFDVSSCTLLDGPTVPWKISKCV